MTRYVLSWIAFLALASHCAHTPTVDKRSEGMSLLEPVTSGLETYRSHFQRYPSSLKTLVPRYVSEAPTGYDGWAVQYIPEQQGYQLVFWYNDDGMHECRYSPQAGWSCRDH